MKIHKKPDLLFVLAVIAGVGVTVSSYIQYARANANAPDESLLDAKQLVQKTQALQSSFVLVSSQAPQPVRPNGDPVNKSLP